MSLKSLSNLVTSKAGRQILKVRKHSPVILFAAGTVGMVATVVLACRATLKMHDILDEHDAEVEGAKKIHDSLKEYSDEEGAKDLLKININTGLKIAKIYAPAVGVGIFSIGALTGSHIVLSRRYAGVTAAYVAVSTGFDEYRKRVEEKYGKDVDLEMRHGTELREIVEEGPTGPEIRVLKTAKFGKPSMYAKWFDQGSRNFQRDPYYNAIFLSATQKFMNDKLLAQGHVFLNEVYDALDIPRTKEGAVVGWIKDGHVNSKGDGYINFADAVIHGETQEAREFFNGLNKAVLLDFNVDGIIYDLI